MLCINILALNRFPLLLLALCSSPCLACMWDRDTLAAEAEGRHDVMKTITGWFDCYLPQDYEMRLARVTARMLNGHPTPA